MVHDAHPGGMTGKILLQEPVQPGILSVRHDKNIPDKRGETKDGSDAETDFPDTFETGRSADIVIARRIRIQVLPPLCGQDRIVTIYPGDQGIYRKSCHTISWKRSGIRTISSSSNIAGLFQA